MSRVLVVEDESAIAFSGIVAKTNWHDDTTHEP